MMRPTRARPDRIPVWKGPATVDGRVAAMEVWHPLDTAGAPLPYYLYSLYCAAGVYVRAIVGAARLFERERLYEPAVTLLRAATNVQTQARATGVGGRAPMVLSCKPPPCGVEACLGEWLQRLAVDGGHMQSDSAVLEACDAAAGAGCVASWIQRELEQRATKHRGGAGPDESPGRWRPHRPPSTITIAARLVAGAAPHSIESDDDEAAAAAAHHHGGGVLGPVVVSGAPAMVLGPPAARRFFAGAAGPASVEELVAEYFMRVQVRAAAAVVICVPPSPPPPPPRVSSDASSLRHACVGPRRGAARVPGPRWRTDVRVDVSPGVRARHGVARRARREQNVEAALLAAAVGRGNIRPWRGCGGRSGARASA